MLQRLIPWRNNPPIDLHSSIKTAANLILYLVHENGPTSFILMDKQGQKYRVSIGQQIKCSCSPDKNDHCVHTLYAMIKIFKIPIDNPLLWQGSYIDPEIGQITQIRYSQVKKSRFSSSFKRHMMISERNVNAIEDNSYYYDMDYKTDHSSSSSINNDHIQNRLRASSVSGANRDKIVNRLVLKQPLNPEDLCSICHENMNEDEGLTYCRKGCGNIFHIKCCFIWAQYKSDHRDLITCPICRCDWGDNALAMLSQEQYEFNNRLLIHKGHICQGCKNGQRNASIMSGQNNVFLQSPRQGKCTIIGKLFHCLYCDNYELCERCYLSFEHYEHNKFLVKESTQAEWIPAKSREKLYLRKNKNKYSYDTRKLGILDKHEDLDKHLALLAVGKNEGNMSIVLEDKRISDEMCLDYQINLDDYILSCFPNYNPEEDMNSTTKMVGISTLISRMHNSNSKLKKVCIICRQYCEYPYQLKKLFCGHLVHEYCILRYLFEKNYMCPDDSLDILKGFKNTLGLANKSTEVIIKLKSSNSPHHNTNTSITTTEIASSIQKIKTPYNISSKTESYASLGSTSKIKFDDDTSEQKYPTLQSKGIMENESFVSNKSFINNKNSSSEKGSNYNRGVKMSPKNIAQKRALRVRTFATDNKMDNKLNIAARLSNTFDLGHRHDTPEKDSNEIANIKQYKQQIDRLNKMEINIIKEDQIEEVSTKRDMTISEVFDHRADRKSPDFSIQTFNLNKTHKIHNKTKKYQLPGLKKGRKSPTKGSVMLLDAINPNLTQQQQNLLHHMVMTQHNSRGNGIKPDLSQYANANLSFDSTNIFKLGTRQAIGSRKVFQTYGDIVQRPKTGLNLHKDTNDQKNMILIGKNTFQLGIKNNSIANDIESTRSMKKGDKPLMNTSNIARINNGRDNHSHTATADSIDKIIDLEEL